MAKNVICVPIDMDELTVLIAEQCIGGRLPKGCSGKETLKAVEACSADGTMMVAGWRRAAAAAALYVASHCGSSIQEKGQGHVH